MEQGQLCRMGFGFDDVDFLFDLDLDPDKLAKIDTQVKVTRIPKDHENIWATFHGVVITNRFDSSKQYCDQLGYVFLVLEANKK